MLLLLFTNQQQQKMISISKKIDYQTDAPNLIGTKDVFHFGTKVWLFLWVFLVLHVAQCW